MRKASPKAVRMLTACVVLVAAGISYAFHVGFGVPSAFGIGQFSLLCPLGGLEVLLADALFVPQVVASLIVMTVLALLVGRSWCSWGCPAQVVRGVFGRKQVQAKRPACSASLVQTFKQDSRLWVLAGVLIAAFVVGFPVFCLVCPVGLTFGTVFSVIALIQSNEVSWGLLVFPIALAVELVVMRRWCVNICPIAGLLSLFGRFAKPFRPQVDSRSCLQSSEEGCHACFKACPEAIDLHADDAQAQLADCTRCGECAHACPTKSVTMPILPAHPKADAESGEERV